MKSAIFSLFLSSCLFLSCGNEQQNNQNQVPNLAPNDSTTAKYDANVHLFINYPTDIWQTDYLAFRIFHSNNQDSRDWFSYSESSYKEAQSVGASCWNLVFYNAKTKDYYQLDSTQKMLIYDYVLNDTARGKVVRNIARYDVQFDDNKDGKFTNADAKRLFVSDRLGKFFHQVSPDGVSVLRYEYAKKENFILIYGQKDANKDSFFDVKDPETVYRLDMNQSAEKTTVAQPLFSKEFEKILQKRIETDWKLPEK